MPDLTIPYHTIYTMQTSSLVVPRAFIECEVRVYDKRRLKDRAPDDEGALRYNHHNQSIVILISYGSLYMQRCIDKMERKC